MKKVIASLLLVLASIGIGSNTGVLPVSAASGVQYNCVATTTTRAASAKCYSLGENPAYNGLMRIHIYCTVAGFWVGPYVLVGNSSYKACPGLSLLTGYGFEDI